MTARTCWLGGHDEHYGGTIQVMQDLAKVINRNQ